MNTRYEIRGCLKYAEEDSFEEGCLPDTGTQVYIDLHWHDRAVEGLVNQLRAFVPFDTTDNDGIELDAVDEDGRIDISGMETDDGSEPSEEQLRQWRIGERRLWYVTYTFHVEEVTRTTPSLTLAK